MQAIQANSAVAVAPLQSRLFGDDKGSAFNDVETVGRYPADMTINVNHPIRKVQVMFGWLVDGISITYEILGGATTTVNHGTEPGTGQREEFTLASDENIIAISGRAGDNHPFGKRIGQISFVIYDRSTGQCRVVGPFGTSINGTPFRVTTNGAFISFGGYAVTSTESIWGGYEAGRLAGLYGLTFTDVAYCQA